MSAQPSPLRRIATASGLLAALTGLFGTLSLLGVVAPVTRYVPWWRDVAVRVVTGVDIAYLVRVTSGTVSVTPRSAGLFAVSMMAAFAVWTDRRWLVWTLAVAAAGVAGVGTISFGVYFVPPALLLLLTGLLLSFTSGGDVSEQPDVTF